MIYKQLSVSKLLKYTKSQYDNTQLTAKIEGNYYGMKYTHARITKMNKYDSGVRGLYELRILEDGADRFIEVARGFESLEDVKRAVLMTSVKRSDVEELDRLDEEHFFKCYPRFRTGIVA